MSVKAKFKCDSVTNYEHSKEANLSAVTSGEGNSDFTQYTPNGRLSITIFNDAVASQYFEPGKEYFLTFEKSE